MHAVRSLIALSAALLLVGAADAEPAVASTPLWTAIPATLPAVDIDPARPGIELPITAEACTISPADANGLITVSHQIKLKIYSADGKQVVLAPTTSNIVKSGKFPDPRLSRFQCNGANVTNYRAQFPGMDADNASQGSGVPVGSGGFNNACAPHTFEASFALCDELPQRSLGIVAAKGVGGERVVLLAQAINLQYHNNLSPDDVNASGFSVSAYAMNGTQLWTRAFKGADNTGYTYVGNLASVGDFLDSDGTEEIRLLGISETGSFRYTYINPLTGDNIRVVTVTPPTL